MLTLLPAEFGIDVTDPGNPSGYMGSGKPQIKLVEAPEWPEDQLPPPRPVNALSDDRRFEGETRADELQETLKNLKGMDVYVEGVDGPSRDARQSR